MNRLPDVLITAGAVGMIAVGFWYDIRAGCFVVAGVLFAVGLCVDCCSAIGGRK